MSQCPCHPQRQHIIRSHGVPIPPQTQLTGAHDMAFEPTLLPIFPENYHPNQWEKKMVTHVDVPHPGNWSPLPRYPDDVEVAAAPEVYRRMPPPTVKKGTPWTEDEHRLFLLGLKIYRRGNWRSISRYCVISRTSTQVASHAQKYFIRQEIPKNERKRRSIHDITLEDESNQIQNWLPPLTLPDNHNWVPPLPNVAMQQARELQQTQQMLHPDPLQELQQPQDTSNSNPHLMELSRFLMKTCKN